MTTCTICRAATHGHDDDDEAWCTYCFDHYIVQRERTPRRLRVETSLGQTPPVFTREALLAMRDDRAETL